MRRAFIDSNIPIYALGADSPHREACLEILRQAARGKLELHASVELVQEVLFHRMRRTDAASALSQARMVMAACVLHDFDQDVLGDALAMVERDALRGRDAVHAATALRAGFAEFVTIDSDFDAVSGLVRVDPSTIFH